MGIRSGDEDERERERAELREAQRIAGIGSWECRISDLAVTWSEGLHLILGRPVEGGAPTVAELPRCYTAESWARLEPAIAAAMATGAVYELELEMVRSDGTTCWTATRGEVVRDGSGQVIKLRGTVHDISARRRAEAAAREREDQLREAQRIARIGSWTYRLADDAITWSEGLHLLLRRPIALGPPTFAGLPTWYAPASWAQLEPVIREAIAHGTPYELELEMVRGDGTTCWTITHGEVVRDDAGTITSLRGTVLDVTERRQLQTAASQADRLSSMGLLAAGVAHEINNPLAYVVFNVESLAQDLPRFAAAAARCLRELRAHVGPEVMASLEPELALLAPRTLADAADCAREALDGCLRIRVLTRSLGTFSRVEKAEESPVDLRVAIESAATMAHNEIKYRARLVKELGTTAPVWASEGKLSQVFLNLLINAAHAIDEGQVERHRITIRTWADGPSVYAEVADTGHGIPAEHLHHLFEPFFSTKEAGKGTGLGLAICKNIVSEFGGDIQVSSEVGRGTRFQIRLPAAEGSGDSTKPVRPSRQATGSGRILVVDDDEGTRRTLERSLGTAHRVVSAASGAAGRAILAHDQAFDAVLCDTAVSGMTAVELHRWLVTHHPWLAERMVFLVGGAGPPGAAEYLANARNEQLRKPLDGTQLTGLIASLVDRPRP